MKSEIENIIKTHIELHGKNVCVDSIFDDYSRQCGIPNHPYAKMDIEERIEIQLKTHKSKNKKYGVMMGRFQPFHFGHQNIVNEIILDGKVPIICIGSINADRDLDKNPLTFEERKELIETIYPNNEVIIVGIEDKESWDEWSKNIITAIGQKIYSNDVTLYYHNKEVDRHKIFEFQGIIYKDEFYTKIFEVIGFNMKSIEFVNREDFKINADGRDIRHNLEGFKHFLDGRIYNKLKLKGWN